MNFIRRPDLIRRIQPDLRIPRNPLKLSENSVSTGSRGAQYEKKIFDSVFAGSEKGLPVQVQK
jgi:hypothetical protein